MSVITEGFGILAACLTTASFVPQAVLTLRTRETAGISLVMYTMFTLGVASWLVYGVRIGSMPIILANVVTVGLAGTILVIKARAVLAGRDTPE